jgi:hypothetical protein
MNQLTLLQRLRTAGRHDLAELAISAWPRGGQIAAFGTLESDELRADVDRANAQAIRRPA